MSTTDTLDHLQQVQELNRVFLGLLQGRVRTQGACLGLPLAVRPSLRIAGPDLLDALARFPRALFRFHTAARSRVDFTDLDASYDEAEHDLSLSILLAARHTSRQSGYQARLLFGLEEPEVRLLCTLSLPDLQRLACRPASLQCALRDRQWFWHGLLTATRPEVRRQLTLMALQPRVSLEWPQRKPPQTSG